MTPTRATEIIEQAHARSTCGPWVDQIRHVMSGEERLEVLTVWRTMPGYTCFVDALFQISREPS